MEYKSVCERLNEETNALYEKLAEELRPLWKKYVNFYKQVFNRLTELKVTYELNTLYMGEQVHICYIIRRMLLSKHQFIKLDNILYVLEAYNDIISDLNIIITVDNLEEILQLDNVKQTLGYYRTAYLISYLLYKNVEVAAIIDRLYEMNRELCDELQKLLVNTNSKITNIPICSIQKNTAKFHIDIDIDTPQVNIAYKFLKCIAKDNTNDYANVYIQF